MSKRIEIKQVLKSYETLVGKEIIVGGLDKGIRSNKFIALNDGTSMNTLQIVIGAEEIDNEILDKLCFHIVLK